MSAPQRIQRRRTKGWRMPEGAVYVGRPTYWGNPFIVGKPTATGLMVRDAEHAVELYWRYVMLTCIGRDAAYSLRGRDLACWCPLDQPCHADVLLQLARPIGETKETPQ